jgi:hypothetical protein
MLSAGKKTHPTRSSRVLRPTVTTQCLLIAASRAHRRSPSELTTAGRIKHRPIPASKDYCIYCSMNNRPTGTGYLLLTSANDAITETTANAQETFLISCSESYNSNFIRNLTENVFQSDEMVCSYIKAARSVTLTT